MHGIIFAELKKFVVAKMGGPAWNRLVEEADLASRTYLPGRAYPDEEVLKLVATASRITSTPAGAILEDFGRFIAPDLLKMYESQINPAWRTLDVLENTERLMHRAVRAQMPEATPPRLTVGRAGPEAVNISYSSPRKMCSLATGIAHGIADHYHERVTVEQPTCMLRGDAACEIQVRRSG